MMMMLELRHSRGVAPSPESRCCCSPTATSVLSPPLPSSCSTVSTSAIVASRSSIPTSLHKRKCTQPRAVTQHHLRSSKWASGFLFLSNQLKLKNRVRVRVRIRVSVSVSALATEEELEAGLRQYEDEQQQQQQLGSPSAATLPFRIFLSTGDVMGDKHGANLVKEISRQAKELRPGRTIELYALGGQHMKEAGATLIGDNTGLSSIGLLEALPLIVQSLHLQTVVRRFIDDHPPDVLVLLDYPGVNIPFGQYVKQRFASCRIIYYIPPNEWLWNKSRSGKIISMSDTILAVYQGEADYYSSIGGNVELVGHPLVDAVTSITRDNARKALGLPAADLVIALFPASRAQELRHVWPVMAAAAGKLLQALAAKRGGAQGIFFVISEVLPGERHLITRRCESNGIASNSLIWNGDSHLVMAAADVAITKSGSANLELALYNVPQVVVYKIDAVTAWIARRVFKFSVEHISLVNLILNSQTVPEFIQEEADADMIMQATLELLPLPGMTSDKRRGVLQGYKDLHAHLGTPGAVSRAAQHILESF